MIDRSLQNKVEYYLLRVELGLIVELDHLIAELDLLEVESDLLEEE